MKYWRGYLVAAILAAFTWALTQLGEKLSSLVDLVYPYITRTVQSMLAQWSAAVPVCVWQVGALVLLVLGLLSVLLMVLLRWNPIQWLGWVLSVISLGFFLHTLMYGLNQYAGPLAEDIRLEVADFTVEELEAATEYFRDQANALADKLERDENGDLIYDDFSTLANQAGEGFRVLTYEKSQPVFAGSMLPVKELAWSGLFTSAGYTGLTVSFTGEAAVNPEIPVMSLPFTMCHEMAHRMSIANETDANLAAFLASMENPDDQFRYSAYFMAYRYCYYGLSTVGSDDAAKTAARIQAGENENLRHDMTDYNEFFRSRRNETAAKVADAANDTYLKASGEERGILAYDQVYSLLVSWHLQEVVAPNRVVEEVNPFNPLEVDPYAPLPTEPEGAAVPVSEDGDE